MEERGGALFLVCSPSPHPFPAAIPPLPLRPLLLPQKVMSTPSPPHMPGWRRQDKIGYPPSSPPSPFLYPLAYKLMERGPLAFTGEGRGKKHLQTSPAPMHSGEYRDEGGRGKKGFCRDSGRNVMARFVSPFLAKWESLRNSSSFSRFLLSKFSWHSNPSLRAKSLLSLAILISGPRQGKARFRIYDGSASPVFGTFSCPLPLRATPRWARGRDNPFKISDAENFS